MLINILLLISILLMLITYLNIVLKFIKTKNININNLTGFDLAKELTSNYDEINIVESNEVSISKYNLKRRVIRLTTKDYNSNNINTLAKISLLSGYSLINFNKDKNIEYLSKILKSIDYLNKSPILAIIISLLVRKIGDAKLAILLLVIISIYQYLINEINITSKEETTNNLKKIIKDNSYSILESIQNSYLLLNKISFITTLILILRLVLIIIS